MWTCQSWPTPAQAVVSGPVETFEWSLQSALQQLTCEVKWQWCEWFSRGPPNPSKGTTGTPDGVVQRSSVSTCPLCRCCESTGLLDFASSWNGEVQTHSRNKDGTTTNLGGPNNHSHLALSMVKSKAYLFPAMPLGLTKFLQKLLRLYLLRIPSW